MTGGSDHPRDAIQDLLDGRLDAARRAEVEAHLERCETCRAEAHALHATKQVARFGLLPLDLPPGLEDDLFAALEGEDESGQATRVQPPTAVRRVLPRAVLAAAAVVVLAVLAFWVSRDTERPTDLAAVLGRDFESVAGGRLALSLPGVDPPELERRFAAGGIAFPTHVYDLGMMGFTLAGGRVHAVAGRPSALFAYRGPDGAWLICQMYPGSVEELPAGADVRSHDGIRFHTHRRGDVTIVFWQEGSIVCALASDLPEAQVIGLALAKAMKV